MQKRPNEGQSQRPLPGLYSIPQNWRYHRDYLFFFAEVILNFVFFCLQPKLLTSADLTWKDSPLGLK